MLKHFIITIIKITFEHQIRYCCIPAYTTRFGSIFFATQLCSWTSFVNAKRAEIAVRAPGPSQLCAPCLKNKTFFKIQQKFFKMNPIFKIPVHVLVFLYCICVLQHFVSIPYKSLMQCQILVLLIGRLVCN